jgi:GNAT superfamily N-acetyltransferase
MESVVLENFLPNIDEVRQHALQSQFIDWEAPDGETYKRVCITEVPGLQDAIERVMGPVEMLGMGYRLNYMGEEPNNAIHSDLGWGTHALVLYLGDGPSGTAFWEHKATKTKSITVGEVELLEQIKNDWNNESAWELRNYVSMKKNRATIYESRLYHSRYPFIAFGDKPENGRLIAVAFFTPKSPVAIRPAEQSDLRRIVEMSERFYPHTSYWTVSKIPFNPEHVAVFASGLIDNGLMNVATLNDEVVGMIGLIFIPFIFNPEYIHAGEIIWWVEPECWKHGIGEMLLDSIDEPCRESGAVHIQMIDLPNSTLSAAKMYEKKGYILTERSYTKVV